MRSRFQDTPGLFVQRDTKVLQLARAIAHALKDQGQDGSALRVHTYVDDEATTNVLVKAIATAPSIHAHYGLRCTSNIVKPVESERPRVFVYVRGSTPSVEDTPAHTGAVFSAATPGTDPDPERLQNFT